MIILEFLYFKPFPKYIKSAAMILKTSLRKQMKINEIMEELKTREISPFATIFFESLWLQMRQSASICAKELSGVCLILFPPQQTAF